MKNLMLLYILFCFPILIVAQGNNMISFDFALTASENHYHDNDLTSQFQDNYPLLNSNTAKVLAWNVSSSYERKLTNFLVLKAGVEVARHGYKEAEISDFLFPSDHNGMGGTIVRNERYKRFNTSFIVPLNVRFKYPSNKISPYIELGIAPGFNFHSRFNTLIEEEMTWMNNWKTGEILMFSNVAIGIDYQLNEKSILYLQPHFQYELSNGVFQGVEEFYYSIGARVGTRFIL
jgi:hypothetical protein